MPEIIRTRSYAMPGVIRERNPNLYDGRRDSRGKDRSYRSISYAEPDRMEEDGRAERRDSDRHIHIERESPEYIVYRERGFHSPYRGDSYREPETRNPRESAGRFSEAYTLVERDVDVEIDRVKNAQSSITNVSAPKQGDLLDGLDTFQAWILVYESDTLYDNVRTLRQMILTRDVEEPSTNGTKISLVQQSFPQDVIAESIRQLDRESHVLLPEKVLQFPPLPLQRVKELLTSKNESEPDRRFEWVIAQMTDLDPQKLDSGGMAGKTSALIYLKRTPKPNVDRAELIRQFKLQRFFTDAIAAGDIEKLKENIYDSYTAGIEVKVAEPSADRQKELATTVPPTGRGDTAKDMPRIGPTAYKSAFATSEAEDDTAAVRQIKDSGELQEDSAVASGRKLQPSQQIEQLRHRKLSEDPFYGDSQRTMAEKPDILHQSIDSERTMVEEPFRHLKPAEKSLSFRSRDIDSKAEKTLEIVEEAHVEGPLGATHPPTQVPDVLEAYYISGDTNLTQNGRTWTRTRKAETSRFTVLFQYLSTEEVRKAIQRLDEDTPTTNKLPRLPPAVQDEISKLMGWKTRDTRYQWNLAQVDFYSVEAIDSSSESEDESESGTEVQVVRWRGGLCAGLVYLQGTRRTEEELQVIRKQQHEQHREQQRLREKTREMEKELKKGLFEVQLPRQHKPSPHSPRPQKHNIFQVSSTTSSSTTSDEEGTTSTPIPQRKLPTSKDSIPNPAHESDLGLPASQSNAKPSIITPPTRAEPPSDEEDTAYARMYEEDVPAPAVSAPKSLHEPPLEPPESESSAKPVIINPPIQPEQSSRESPPSKSSSSSPAATPSSSPPQTQLDAVHAPTISAPEASRPPPPATHSEFLSQSPVFHASGRTLETDRSNVRRRIGFSHNLPRRRDSQGDLPTTEPNVPLAPEIRIQPPSTVGRAIITRIFGSKTWFSRPTRRRRGSDDDDDPNLPPSPSHSSHNTPSNSPRISGWTKACLLAFTLLLSAAFFIGGISFDRSLALAAIAEHPAPTIHSIDFLEILGSIIWFLLSVFFSLAALRWHRHRTLHPSTSSLIGIFMVLALSACSGLVTIGVFFESAAYCKLTSLLGNACLAFANLAMIFLEESADHGVMWRRKEAEVISLQSIVVGGGSAGNLTPRSAMSSSAATLGLSMERPRSALSVPDTTVHGRGDVPMRPHSN